LAILNNYLKLNFLNKNLLATLVKLINLSLKLQKSVRAGARWSLTTSITLLTILKASKLFQLVLTLSFSLRPQTLSVYVALKASLMSLTITEMFREFNRLTRSTMANFNLSNFGANNLVSLTLMVNAKLLLTRKSVLLTGLIKRLLRNKLLIALRKLWLSSKSNSIRKDRATRMHLNNLSLSKVLLLPKLPLLEAQRKSFLSKQMILHLKLQARW